MRAGRTALQEHPRQRRLRTATLSRDDPTDLGVAPAVTAFGTRPAPGCIAAPAKSAYLIVLTWAFTFFNLVRVLSYVPTLWAIQAAADSSQYSLWTWGTWLGANATMAAWLYERNGHRMDGAVALNAGNAVMCGASVLLIAWYRL